MLVFFKALNEGFCVRLPKENGHTILSCAVDNVIKADFSVIGDIVVERMR
jgi:hypothetical protein